MTPTARRCGQAAPSCRVRAEKSRRRPLTAGPLCSGRYTDIDIQKAKEADLSSASLAKSLSSGWLTPPEATQGIALWTRPSTRLYRP
jgi:hypothetical protein